MELCNGTSINSTLDSLTARDYVRFEPITVRAAVRVVQLHRAGVVSTIEAGFYISELAAMDSHTGPRGVAVLARMACRQASPGGVTRPLQSFAGQQVEMRLAMAA